jgi:predicted PurR-regulated permease PerM
VATDEPGTARASESPDVRVPVLLAGAAAWCWRILVIAGAFLALFLLIAKLQLLVLPFFTAMLLSALLHPAVAFLRRKHWPSGLATTGVLLVAFLIIAAIAAFVINRASAEYPKLVDQVNHVIDQTRHFMVAHTSIDPKNFDNVSGKILDTLRSHQSQIASGVVTAGKTLGEFATGAILAFFITFFLLYDGERIWRWVVDLFPRGAREDLRGAGERAWRTLTGYVAGTFIVALFHGVVIGVTLLLLGTPLVAPLAVLVFIGSFIPIIGAVLFGGLAVLVTLVTQGVVPALIVLVVLIVDNQAEAHLLQPLVVGRYVSLHPLAIAVALTGGALLAGLPGAIFAVPIVAAVNAGVGHVREQRDSLLPEEAVLPEESPPEDLAGGDRSPPEHGPAE